MDNLYSVLQEKLKLLGDTTVWMVTIFLCMISIVEVYSASSRDSFGGKAFWEPAVTHAGYVIGGLLCVWIVSEIPYKLFKLLCPVGLVISIFMLVYLACGGGVTLNGGTRWMEILGIRFQPSEITKICLVGTIASLLSSFRDKERNEATLNALLWIGGFCFVACALIFKENLSTAGIIGIVALMMCWYGKANLKWLSRLTILLLIGGGGFLYFLKYTPTSTIDAITETTGIERLSTGHHRLNSSLELPEDPNDFKLNDYNTQEIHARIAVATGGFWGKGPGRSVQRDFLPMAFSDFIYSIIAEEFGFIGSFIVLGLYFVLLYRSLILAKRCQNQFPAYLILGLSLMLAIQALVNMSVSVGVFPVTGQPLPLVSKGGTSTFMTCLYLGMILSVSHTARQKQESIEESRMTNDK